MRVLFRTDASKKVGAGHFMRSIALAQHLQDQGAYVKFLTVPWKKELLYYLKQQNFDVQALDLNEEELGKSRDCQLITQEMRNRFDWVVLDNHYFALDYQNTIMNLGIPLLVLDDRRTTAINATLVVSHSFVMQKHDGINCEEYLPGPNYALLRRELLGAPRRNKAGSKNVLVAFGGSSQRIVLDKVLRAILRLMKTELHVKFLSGFDDLGSTDTFAHSSTVHKIEGCRTTFDLSGLYDWADVAICAAGGTCLELCFFGAVGITGALAEHQIALGKGLEETGAFKFVGLYSSAKEEGIAQAFSKLIEDGKSLTSMREKARALVDGKGASRIWKAMKQVRKNREGLIMP